MASSRARKILGLVEQNIILSTADSKNSTLNEINSSSLNEISADDETEANLKEKTQMVRSDYTSHSLVPYDDIAMSADEDDTTKYELTCKDNSVPQPSMTIPSSSPLSSSSSSSSSTSSSSSSSSDSESESSRDASNHGKNQITAMSNNETVDDNSKGNDDTPTQIENTDKYQESSSHRRQGVQNYQISPLYTDESNVDLSDPTFVNTEHRRTKNYLFDVSGCSSTSSFDTEMADSSPKKIGRKRTKNPSKWKQNLIKRMRNKGKSYVSMSKSQRKVPARCLKEPCTDKCRHKCVEKINMDNRYNLFQNIWDLADLRKQRAYITSCMVDIEPKYKYSYATQPRRNNKAFFFKVDNTKIRVCKTFFKATLDISDRMIFTIISKFSENGYVLEDLRGRHKNHRKIDPELRTAMKMHINSIPRIESHYLRASTSKEYIEGGKTIKKLYNDFKQQYNRNEAGTYITYYKIFTGEFNIGFFEPKKDQCDQCTSYNNSNTDQKSVLKDKYMAHMEEKKCSRIEKLNDRKKVNKNFRVAVYDLEAVLQCPKGDTSPIYYKSKLNCYNLTITELAKKDSKVGYENVHCYFWSECDAKRGAIEVGSCVWEYLKMLSEQDNDEKEVIFYSDNCCGQNKNKYIACLYLYAVNTLNIKSITHKFLITGHTQNEADSVHSLIEKEIKRNLKSGPIYTPDQYITLIKNAKKPNPPLSVHELTFKSFYDLKALQEEWGYNFSTNTDGQNVNWNEIKVLKMNKRNSTSFYYKSSYKEENYKEVDTRNKRKKMKPTTEVILKAAYTAKQELSANKKKDLKELITKSLIPTYYADFYNSIL